MVDGLEIKMVSLVTELYVCVCVCGGGITVRLLCGSPRVAYDLKWDELVIVGVMVERFALLILSAAVRQKTQNVVHNNWV